MRAGHVAVVGDHHTLARGQPVILDHPGGLGCSGTEAIQRGIKVGRVVDGLAARGTDAGGRHHVFGERLGTLDPGGVLRRAEAGDPRSPHRIGDAENQRHLGPDDHQVHRELASKGGDGFGW